uniref:Lipoprotein n=1 Tax=Streptomyces lavendulae TaxID=1914 RepID=A0A2Z5TKV3_STRLA|nr:lipoprotein [Streptomyces lavendulae]
MRPPQHLLPALTVLLLLAGCGAPASAPAAPPADGVRITSVTVPSGSDGPGVRAGDSGISAAYEVTNGGTGALAYTILFDFTTDAGEVMGNTTATVRAVGPGATVRGTVRLGAPGPGSSRVTRVKVSRVTKVPAAEAPPEAGACPPSGIRVTADDGDAAMGLRVVGLRLENCGKADYALDGYPQLELLDGDLSPVQGIRIVQGSGGITTGTGFDDPARPLVLKPGESALSGLMWRNTTESGDPVNVPHVRVRAKEGADPVTVTPHLDLGTTGRLAVRAWTRPTG